ncbi:MAG TPA: tetratricopeptide repeat protein [Bryobacteraceae bacterium]|nr:tetratricopeptide repeat protein [Bryobacteraceae bacterium]
MVSRILFLSLAAGLSFTALAGSDDARVDTANVPDGLLHSPQAEPPPKPLTFEQRGDIMMARKMYREAIDTFRQGLTDNAVIWNKIGIAYQQLLLLNDARKSYERSLRIKPDYSEALNNLGTVYYAKKNYRKAINYYKKALKYNPESASLYSNLGTAYFARKKYKEASQAYQTALKLNPDVFEQRGSYGVMLQERNVEEYAKYHYYLAKVYAKAGMNDQALQCLRKALEEGFKDKDKLKEDPEFQAMRKLPEFQQLLTSEPRVL